MKRLPINKTALLFCFLLFLVCISYSNTLYSPFVLDDYSAFVDNKNLYLEDISLKSLSRLLRTRFGAARVIPLASFALDHHIAQGKSILSYHVTNILIHVLATISIAFLLAGLLQTGVARGALKFFRPAYMILAVCGLWALSPLQTNGVTYLVQRMTSMAALFYITACGFYVHARLAKTSGLRFLYFASFLLASCAAFFSKENSWILPLTLLLLEFVFLSPDAVLQLLRKSRWYHWLLIIIIVVLLLPLAGSYFQRLQVGFSGRHFTMPERLLTELRIVVLYMSFLLLPLPGRLNLEHDIPLSTSIAAPPTTLLSLLLILGLLWLAFFLRKKHPFLYPAEMVTTPVPAAASRAFR